MRIKQFFLQFFTIFATFLFVFPWLDPAFAQVVFTDDFSNGFEKWQDIRNLKDFNMWSIVQEKADVYISKGSTLAEIIPKDEYWNNDWKNYIYKLDYIYFQGADKALSFWIQDVMNWYQFHFVGGGYILSHIKEGNEIWRQSGALSLISGQTYRMEVHLNDGNIKFIRDGEKMFEYDDPTFDNDHGRIGLKAGAGAVYPTHVQFDNIEVSLITDNLDHILPISILKQIDPLWKDVEYDSAKNWAKEKFGIGDWGCLITSINMILKYHNITKFPDGLEITPESLNSWLLNQPDGYLGKGLVNWSAVSRLVKQIHDKTGSINLEYTNVPGDSLETAIAEIQNQNPVILEIPGHFVVGNGFKQDKSDVFISDPAYTYTLLSEHEVPMQSTRLLTPSNTDLSYIHMAHDESIFVELKNSDSTNPSNYQSFSQHISSFSTDEVSPTVILHEFSKPETNNYEITVSSNSPVPVPFEITMFAYDIDANLSNLTYQGVISLENPTVLNIYFNKNGQSTLKSNVSFETLILDIDNLKNQNHITKQYVAYELKQLVKAAINASSTNKPRYITALQKTILWYSQFISQEAQVILSKRLNEVKTNL